MPTNFNMLFPPFTGRKMPGGSDSGLCRPLIQEQPDRIFLSILEEEDLPLTLRHFSPAKDLSTLCRCLHLEEADIIDDPDDQMEEAYSSIIASDAIQTFIGMVGEEPICELDIIKIRQHMISLYYDARPGDHYLDLFPIDGASPRVISRLVDQALKYFFSFPEVGRIIVEAGKQDEEMNILWQGAGFRWRRSVETQERLTNMYVRKRGPSWRPSFNMF